MLGVQHEFAGGIIGLIFSAWILIQGHPLLAAGCFLITVWGANLPDLIDPPTSPFHRSIGHNFVSLLMFILIFLCAISLSLLFKWWPFIIASSFSLGVLSHLFLDLITPMGLPLFTGKSLFGIIEIPLYLIPWINVLMVIVTIVLAFWTIKITAQKIGGKWALALLLIPIWGTLLLFGIGLLTVSWLKWLGIMVLFLFVICIGMIIGIGQIIDDSLQTKRKE